MTIDEIRKRLFPRKSVVKCFCCGKKLIVPGMYGEDLHSLQPFCCATTVLHVQWLIYHGWHVRNLGLHDSHPYFCPDCWTEGTPEYSRCEYCDEWVEQAKKWMNDIK